MKKSVVLLMVLAAGSPAATSAASQGSVVITIPLPVRAQLTFGQHPVAFVVPPQFKATVNGTTVSIVSANPSVPLQKRIEFSSPTTLCFKKGVQNSYTLVTAILPSQVKGIPVCAP